MKTIKEFISFGLNKIEASKDGERYQANCKSRFDGTRFRTLKEAREFARDMITEWGEV